MFKSKKNKIKDIDEIKETTEDIEESADEEAEDGENTETEEAEDEIQAEAESDEDNFAEGIPDALVNELDEEDFEDFEEEEAEEKPFFLTGSDVFHIVRILAFIVFVVSIVYSVSHPNKLAATIVMYVSILFIITLFMAEKK